MDKNNIKINTVFRPHKRTLKKIAIIRAKADKIEIRFPPNLFKKRVKLVQGNPNLIIIDSLRLANEIREQLGLKRIGIQEKPGKESTDIGDLIDHRETTKPMTTGPRKSISHH